MADAQEIYRRFCAAPLRLRTKPSPPSASDAAPVHATREDPAPQSGLQLENPATEAALVLLEERIQLECRVDDAPNSHTSHAKRVVKKKAPQWRTRAKLIEPAPVLSPPHVKDDVASMKHKRVTRAVAMVNSNTGGVCVDTPTKAAAPPKRSRKALQLPESIDDLGDICMGDADKENISISKNIMDALDEGDEALSNGSTKRKSTRRVRQKPAVRPKQTRKPASRAAVKSRQHPQEPTRRSSRLRRAQPTSPNCQADFAERAISGDDAASADISYGSDVTSAKQVKPLKPPPVVDVLNEFCEPLLQTKTTCGALFALWFSALGLEVDESTSDVVQTLIDVLRTLYSICVGISRCEALARSQDPDDEGIVDELSEIPEESKTSKGKAVRFRHFDLSTLNLSYIDDDTAASLVEELLGIYVGIVDHVATLWDRHYHPAQAALIAQVVDVINNTDRLAAQSGGKGMVATAFFSMSKSQHDEIRASQPFFSREFSRLSLPPQPASPKFLEGMFSSLVSSLARFRLRELFLPFEPRALLNEGEKLQIATYDHQDFGAAIHHALKEVYHFHVLAAPILAVIQESGLAVVEDTDRVKEDALKNAVMAATVDDLIHVERYILAARYLRLSFGRCILLDNEGDIEACKTRANLEQLCVLARRLHFEDEAHLFPLSSIEDFVKELEAREPALAILENALQGVALPHYDPEAPCVECNEIVTRREQSEAISCISCDGRFHLRCLHLPASFAQFAGSYTCPSCYLGRTR